LAFSTLHDGGLSVKVGGVESRAITDGLEWESTGQGDGGGSFSVALSNPMYPLDQYPQLTHGAPVTVEHTYAGLTTRLYTGFVVNDPCRGSSAEVAKVDVELGGHLELAKSRGDWGFTFTDSDTGAWFPNKQAPHCFGFNNTGRIAVTVGDNVKVPHDRAGMIGAVAYMGATHLFKGNGGPLPGFKRILCTVSVNLKDKMRAALLWKEKYTDNLDASDYHVIARWGPNEVFKDHKVDVTFGGADGAGYVCLALYADVAAGIKTTDERHVVLEGVTLFTNTCTAGDPERTIATSMADIARAVFGAGFPCDVAEVGNLLRTLVVRPYTDPASAQAQLAQQSSDIVEWGYRAGRFFCRPLPSETAAIQATGRLFRVHANAPDVLWDVARRPDTGQPRNVRLIYGHVNKKTDWPAGTPGQVIQPGDPKWDTTTPTMGTTAPVVVVDFSSRNYADGDAKDIALALAQHLGVGEASGSIGLRCPTVDVYGGGIMPTAYLRGGDFIWPYEGDFAPLYVTRCHVDAGTGYVDIDCGLPSDSLLEQLAAVGAIKATALHDKHKKQRRG